MNKAFDDDWRRFSPQFHFGMIEHILTLVMHLIEMPLHKLKAAWPTQRAKLIGAHEHINRLAAKAREKPDNEPRRRVLSALAVADRVFINAVPHEGRECTAALFAEVMTRTPNKLDLEDARQQIRDCAADAGDVFAEKPPAMSEHMRDVLRALYALKAFDRESRKSSTAIAKKIGIGEAANYKRAIQKLKLEKLLDGTDKAGAKGGCWLTPEGKRIAASL